MARKIEPGHLVTVARDITRKEGPYAKQGERGEVIEVFTSQGTGHNQNVARSAKVRMSDQVIKTFRLTSLVRD